MVKAYLADAATPEQLPSFMAWREAACTLAFIVGPSLGGLMFSANEDLGACIAVTGWASVGAAAVVAVAVREIGWTSPEVSGDGSADEGAGFSSGGSGRSAADESDDDAEDGMDPTGQIDGVSGRPPPPSERRGSRREPRRRPRPRVPWAEGSTRRWRPSASPRSCTTRDRARSTRSSSRCSARSNAGMGPDANRRDATALAAVSFFISAAGFA